MADAEFKMVKNPSWSCLEGSVTRYLERGSWRVVSGGFSTVDGDYWVMLARSKELVELKETHE